jgi:hypothetical protein
VEVIFDSFRDVETWELVHYITFLERHGNSFSWDYPKQYDVTAKLKLLRRNRNDLTHLHVLEACGVVQQISLFLEVRGIPCKNRSGAKIIFRPK